MFEFLQDIFYKPQKKINVSPQKKKSIEFEFNSHISGNTFLQKFKTLIKVVISIRMLPNLA